MHHWRSTSAWTKTCLRRSSSTDNRKSFIPPPPKSYPYETTVGRTTQLVVGPPKNPRLVPKVNRTSIITSSEIKLLEWMLRKDQKLKQDMFLIGPPGGFKRNIVELYGYLMQREMEVVQLTRDTTEADIKQSRDIVNKAVVFRDQASVRCALNGRVLVLDGIEKAERNVLPVLNNLLENREMNLEDGRQLIPAYRYDSLVELHGETVVNQEWKLERVHEMFRVIALGLPVPAFHGNPLDPPLRSRFQAKYVDGVLRDEMVEVVLGNIQSGSDQLRDAALRMVDLGYSINLVDSSVKLPWFCVDSLVDGGRLLEKLGHGGVPTVLAMMYPSQTDNLATHLGEDGGATNSVGCSLNFSALNPPPFNSQERVLELLYQFITMNPRTRAPLLYGPQASGKSTVVNQLGQLLGVSNITTIQVYKDMSVRELLQWRTTDENGDTVWWPSALVRCALNGGICVIDGFENLHSSVVGVLGRLVEGRGVMLPDGVSVLGGELMPVHPEFKVVLVGNSDEMVELSEEVMSVVFVFGVEMQLEEEVEVAGGGEVAKKLVGIAKELRRLGGKGELGRALSVGQIKRINGRVVRRGGQLLYDDVMNACLGEFVPAFERDHLEDVLKRFGVVNEGVNTCSVKKKKSGVVMEQQRITGGAGMEWVQGKVPKGGVFFDIDSHVKILESMVDDFVHGGDHLLLVGNQGVGKNKLVDRMLEVIGRGREYIQLHRDTTVHSLTTLQRIEQGVVKILDSPLVNACRHGLVLVVDEADKAPAHVTACLKALAERSEMVLPDGRTIKRVDNNCTDVIPLHRDFRMIVLANRPGFPFLGNSFYNMLSHLFSVYVIGNPEFESEVQLLRNYGPSVGEDVVGKVAKVFGRLRALSSEGVLGYPYSLREAVHVVRHLEMYPGDYTGAFCNVFDFDRMAVGCWETVLGVVKGEFGDNVDELGEDGGDSNWVLRIVETTGGDSSEGGESGRKELGDTDPKEGEFDPTGAAHVGGNTWAGGSGGTSTAGLGGVGGPYRLSDGNPVFEISPELKRRVAPEMVSKARAVSRQLYEQKLKQLELTPHDASVYESYLAPIRTQVEKLRTIVSTLQSQSNERKWARHQTHGDLDDTKLIEGLIGDKNVYKSRQEMKPEVGDPQQKPKLLRLLVDCSASMYRFNGYDRRLDRTLSCVLMMMEGFRGFEMFQFQVYGHSGDGYDFEFACSTDGGGRNERTNLEVLKRIHLHSQFCMSGDSTLEATHWSVTEMEKVHEDYDEMFLVVLSDANFERYGIDASEVRRVLNSSSNHVRVNFVFIGSLGDQAHRMVQDIGAGVALTCMDAAHLPTVLHNVLTEGVLRS